MGKGSFRLKAAYTRVPNNLIEAIISYPFNATEHKVVWFIIRMSYGWNRDMAFISYGALSKKLGCDTRYIKRLVKRLKNNRVILIEKMDKVNLIGLNRDYKTWMLWKTKKLRWLM